MSPIKGTLTQDTILTIELKNEQIDTLYKALSTILDKTVIGFVNTRKITEDERTSLLELQNLLQESLAVLDSDINNNQIEE